MRLEYTERPIIEYVHVADSRPDWRVVRRWLMFAVDLLALGMLGSGVTVGLLIGCVVALVVLVGWLVVR